MAKSEKIRGGWQAVVMGSVGGWFAQSLAATLNVEIDYECEGPLTKGPRIFILWHNRILGAAPAAKPWLAFRPVVVLTSASKDGTVLATAMECFNLISVRGSSSRRGAAALVALRRALQEGHHVAVTPDGPKGPPYRIQPGIVKLASLTGTPIIPFHVDYEKSWRLKSWDRFHVPKPFSRVRVVFGEEFVIPKGLDEDEFELERKRVEKAMGRRLNGVR